MKKNILLLTTIFFYLNGYAQKSAIEIVEQKKGSQILLYVKNNSLATQSVKLNVEGYGFEIDNTSPIIVIVPAKKQSLGATITFSATKKYSYKYNSTYILGNINAKHNNDYVYSLPYKNATSYRVNQAYDGTFSHKGIKAVDFSMPINTAIYAVRDGVVIKVKKNSKKGCPSIKCIDNANFVWIEHEDGTIASYVHLRYRGTALKVGTKVKKGQKIAFSGNTGFSGGPHLHLEIFIQLIDGYKKTLTTLFEVGKEKAVILKKDDNYINP